MQQNKRLRLVALPFVAPLWLLGFMLCIFGESRQYKKPVKKQITVSVLEAQIIAE